MTEKEKIIKGLEYCTQELNCSNCPYNEIAGSLCHKTLFNDFKGYFLNSDEIAHFDTLPCIAYTTPDLRPCVVNGEKKFFHGWFECAEGGLSEPVGIVEDENGVCTTVNVTSIKFTDRNVKND